MANKNPTNVTDTATPLMRQYGQLKSKYPDAIMLFRIGDFYETFGQDAVTTARVLGITLTARNNGAGDSELAGFPYHSLDVYLPRLVRAGFRVAICEQLEKPVPGRVVRRGVTEVITPGVTTDDKLLDQKKNNYLAGIAPGRKDEVGVALLDISTGELMVTEGNWAYLEKLFQTFQPSELLFPKPLREDILARFGDSFYSFGLEDWVFTVEYAREKLLSHFEVTSLKGFGVEDMGLAQIAAGATLHYLASTENTNLKHINTISRLLPERYVWLDKFTIRNLELLQTPYEHGTPLISVLDQTLSPMGARLMRKWVVLPLKHQAAIEARLDMVSWLIANPDETTAIEQQIRLMGDMERLISKVPLQKINPREVVQLRRALMAIEPVREVLRNSGNDPLAKIGDGLHLCEVLRTQIEQTIVAEPPVNLHKGGVIADGANPELDELRNIVANGQQLLVEVQQREIERTGIHNLKIGFNNVFGYYLEVTNKYKHTATIPTDWVRKQTLTTGERYISQELKVLEEKILGAEEKIAALEGQLYEALVFAINDFIQPIQHNAMQIAVLDCLLSFARTAQKNNYCRPVINDSLVIDIRDGRHPVIEANMSADQSYVPNDVLLDSDDMQIIMITGPNMSGKSALLRQTALICLMAQMGSYVPAATANIGIVDKVFTRVGASDNISSGESTFMVEMNETASIVNNISERSLVLLDEIGRGTSTYDGISIAWSIAEWLHENGQNRPRTLFATHYHELNELSEKFPRIKNFNVQVRETGQKVIFLRKLMPGGSEHSFGIHVAKMAGLPPAIIKRANEILSQLEAKHIADDKPAKVTKSHIKDTLRNQTQNMQLSIFDTGDPKLHAIRDMLEGLDIQTLTPIECMMKLHEMQKIIG